MNDEPDDFFDALQKHHEYWEGKDKLYNFILLKFTSGNSVPVDRITLTRSEVDQINPDLLRGEPNYENL